MNHSDNAVRAGKVKQSGISGRVGRMRWLDGGGSWTDKVAEWTGGREVVVVGRVRRSDGRGGRMEEVVGRM